MASTQTATDVRVVWTMDCEATQQAVDNADLGERASANIPCR